MRRKPTAFGLTLPPREASVPAYQWLYAALRQQILSGALRAGVKLPSTRDLAREYRLSRGTVVTAFEQLTTEGYIEGTVGSGTFVSSTLPDEMFEAKHHGGAAKAAAAHAPRHFSPFARRVSAFPSSESSRIRAFRPDLPALDLFPTALWAQVAARRHRRVSMSALHGCEALGFRPLREATADYVATSRGVRCTADQIAIVSGVQQALDVVTRLFLAPGDRALVEDPGYPGAAIIFESAGARVVPLPVDEQGLVVKPVKMRGARLVYITPAHQFPLGMPMSLSRRLELLEWARETGALIFEDDYDSEFRFAGKPIPALQGLDHHGSVLFAGSFSKVLFPSLRLGYLVVPHDLVPQFTAALSITTRHAPVMDQAIVCDFITEGHFGRHLRRMRQIYGERLSVLLDEGRRRLDGVLDISDVEAGLQTSAWLRDGMDAETATAAAAMQGVDVVPLTRFSRRPMKREGLQLGFAAFDEQEIRRGVRNLAAALDRSL